ncbi:ParB/RepB/Spo0J family partition protein [Rugamonas apoptosis]|uniref:ParB/RepB/Spo0J family partition protein n=1 Tax=Rugamonas apoptosis TaxID=2758570 RepID=A0A7W2IK50_9BURK|nr:ParB/RepB/Spo0J family partition protein [Rugamonas apoptosis]MBA5687213.1 ParB/RepB/Spo0J family partition protein [Rugamonas apoptosis]
MNAIHAMPRIADAPPLSALCAAVAEAQHHATLCLATFPQLVRSKLNVRRKQTDVTELMGLIRTQGLLQNLIGFRQIIAGVETGIIEIIAGGRRLLAIGLLIEAGCLPDDYSIPVLIVSEYEAIEISVTENLGRQDMHPADLFEAMQDMVGRGRSIEDVALLYNLDILTVKRRLRLANVAPRLLQLYRDDKASFEQMMALAITDDHAAQEQAWDGLGEYRRSPHDLRRMLTAQKVNFMTDRVARYVGLAAYERAGGTVTRDLFSDRATGYIDDVALLERLANEKFERQRAKLLKAGAAWVETLPRADAADLMTYPRVRRSFSKLSDEQQGQVDVLDGRIAAVTARLDSDEAEQDASLEERLAGELDGLERQREAIYATRKLVPHEADLALAGVVLRLNADGKPVVERDMIRPADKGKIANHATVAGKEQSKRIRQVHSDRLTAELTAHRTVALQAEMMMQGQAALAYLTYTLAQSVLMEQGSRGTLAKIGVRSAVLTQAAKQSSAALAVNERRLELLARLQYAEEVGGLLCWLAGRSQAELLEWLAFCVAMSLDGTQDREAESPDFVAVARLVKLDMVKWWRPTADSYFNHVSKERMMKVVTEAVSAGAAVPLEKMRKGEAAGAAERAVETARWLPEPMRTT